MVATTVRVRPELPSDRKAIRRVNLAAFSGPAEADLVDLLRDAGALTLSLVAEQGAEVVGHIAFSPVSVIGEGGTFEGIGLGPMAVAPEHQRRGIGGLLVEAGLAELTRRQVPFVAVLGPPDYYPRFGFVPAARYGLRWENLVTEEAFMVRELQPGALTGVRGLVRYRPEFDGV